MVRAVALGLAFLAGGAAGGSPAPAGVDETTFRIASELRCPVCQNLSVADSPSEMAKQMRALIREKLERGENPEAIKNYFVSKYGEWILLLPPARGFNLLVWGLPLLAVLGGAGGIYLITRRWAGHSRGGEEAPRPDPEYLERVRRELDRDAP